MEILAGIAMVLFALAIGYVFYMAEQEADREYDHDD